MECLNELMVQPAWHVNMMKNLSVIIEKAKFLADTEKAKKLVRLYKSQPYLPLP
jgi:hypothetical protein